MFVRLDPGPRCWGGSRSPTRGLVLPCLGPHCLSVSRERSLKATWLTASSEELLGRWIRSPEKPRTMQFVGQLALLARLSEGRVTDRCGALAPGDGRGPQRDLQARPFLSLGGRMLGSD